MGKAPPCRGVESPPGAGFPPGGGVPPGGKTISFSVEKETVLHPKEKDGVRSTVGFWGSTAASGFRMTAGTPSGRYGLPSGNRDRLRPTHPPPAGASLRAVVVSCLPCGGAGDLCRAQRPRHIAALCRESGTTRRPQDRAKSPSLFHDGMAVTAGAGPHHSA